MNSKTRLTIIIGCIITFVVVPVVAVLIFSSLQPKPVDNSRKDVSVLPDKSNQELLDAILLNNPELKSDQGPTIAIMNVAKPEKGWYVVTIRQIDDTAGDNPAKVLLFDSGVGSNSLRVLLGPGTDFPVETTRPLGIPQKVLTELNT